MMTSLISVLLASVLSVPIVDAKFAQVAPIQDSERPVRTADAVRAVVLVQGLYMHPFSDSNVAVAKWHDWQQPESDLVEALGEDSDVFSLAYAQHLPVDQICEASRLSDKIEQLRKMGYSEVVLVGHSAGGLVARQFVEDHPNAGVTKVVQVCAPNGGSVYGHAAISVRRSQEEFLTSLTKQSRKEQMAIRSDKQIPKNVEFVCVVGHQECQLEIDMSCRFFSFRPSANVRGDWIVSSPCQWPRDLQDQGIPVVPVKTCHLWVVQQELGIDTICRLVRERQPRWSPEQVAAMRQDVLGDE